MADAGRPSLNGDVQLCHNTSFFSQRTNGFCIMRASRNLRSVPRDHSARRRPSFCGNKFDSEFQLHADDAACWFARRTSKPDTEDIGAQGDCNVLSLSVKCIVAFSLRPGLFREVTCSSCHNSHAITDNPSSSEPEGRVHGKHDGSEWS